MDRIAFKQVKKKLIQTKQAWGYNLKMTDRWNFPNMYIGDLLCQMGHCFPILSTLIKLKCKRNYPGKVTVTKHSLPKATKQCEMWNKQWLQNSTFAITFIWTLKDKLQQWRHLGQHRLASNSSQSSENIFVIWSCLIHPLK